MPGSRVSRRSVLRMAGAGASAAMLAACDLDPRSIGTPTTTAAQDADHRVLVAARAELTGLLLRLRSRSTSPQTAALARCHRRQLQALGGRLPSPSRRGRSLTGARLVARERRAAGRFRAWALACHDGDLARVLASVAAGIEMQPTLRGTP